MTETQRQKRKQYQDEYNRKRSQKQKEWANKNKDKIAAQHRVRYLVKVKNDRLQKKFGISMEEYKAMWIEQKGCCAICGRYQFEFKIGLAVDHNHITGKIRGLLCGSCNSAIGKLQDSPLLCLKAKEYLEKYITTSED